ncbi:MAG: hypothetical protein IPP66_19410 [Anaerolineales bacterium]|nr:hypothetical protein [Anaerolineales bacterium]
MKNFVIKYLLVLSLLCLATWIMWKIFGYPLTGIDDANIFFVYAKNVSSGYGFVFNIGSEKVEGFSSLLWTLICVVVFKLSTRPEATLLTVNLLAITLGVTMCLSFIQTTLLNSNDNQYSRQLWSLTFLILLFTSPTYIIWNTITLMENAVWGTLLLVTAIYVIKNADNWMITPLLILLLLTRPEAFLWVTVFTLILLTQRIAVYGISKALKRTISVFIIVTLTIISLTIFRQLYFGYPLPNTYYAKVSPSLSYNLLQGWLYFTEYLISSPVVCICILATIMTGAYSIYTLTKGKLTANRLHFLPVIASTGLAIPFTTGGDHFGSFRFYQGVYPILILCLIYFTSSILPHYSHLKYDADSLRRQRIAVAPSIGLLLVSSFILYQINTWKSFIATSNMPGEFGIAQAGREVGEFAKETFSILPKLPSIGMITVGGVKYAYPGEIVDLMGLNNLLMAHNGGNRLGMKNHAAFEKVTFYQLKPDMVTLKIVSTQDWEYSATELQMSWANSIPLKRLYDDSAFLELYTYAKIIRDDVSIDKALVSWFRKDFLTRLEANGNFSIDKYKYPTELINP